MHGGAVRTDLLRYRHREGRWAFASARSDPLTLGRVCSRSPDDKIALHAIASAAACFGRLGPIGLRSHRSAPMLAMTDQVGGGFHLIPVLKPPALRALSLLMHPGAVFRPQDGNRSRYFARSSSKYVIASRAVHLAACEAISSRLVGSLIGLRPHRSVPKLAKTQSAAGGFIRCAS